MEKFAKKLKEYQYFLRFFSLPQLNSRMKLLKRNLDETEEELQKEKTQKRKYQRECEDMIESQEAMNREINSLKTKLR